METIVNKKFTMFPFRRGKPDKYGFRPTYRRAQCSKCEKTTSYVDTTKNGATDHIVALNLRKRKWHIDEENQQHICATCRGLPIVLGPRYAYMKTPNAEVPAMFFKSKPKPNVEETPTSVTVTPTPVEVERNLAAPTPAQLRQIRGQLNEVYDLVGQRYLASFTDEWVAYVANVPEHWVLIERELAYGPAESPESETEAQVRMLNGLVEQARHHAEEANAALQLVEEKVAALKKKLAS